MTEVGARNDGEGELHTNIAVIARSVATKQPRGFGGCCGGGVTKPLGCFASLAMTEVGARNDGGWGSQ